MTFQGGDITVWSDRGNINAGKGDKAAVNASRRHYSCNNGVCAVNSPLPPWGAASGP